MSFVLIQGAAPDPFGSTQFVVTPLANGKSLLVMTGICELNFTSGKKSAWVYDEVDIFPDFQAPAAGAGLPPPPAGQVYNFAFDQCSATGSLQAIYDKKTAVDMGFSIDAAAAITTGNPRQQAVNGVKLSVGVRDSDATLLKVGYQIVAVGQFITVAG